VSGISAFLCGIILSPIVESYDLATANWVAFGTVVFTYVDGLALCALDKYADSKEIV